MPTESASWRVGVTAGLAGLAAAETVAAVRGRSSLLDAAGRLVVDAGPRPLIDVVVRLLRSSDKSVVRGATAGATLLLGGGMARVPIPQAGRMAAVAAGTGIAAWAGLRRPPRRPVQTLSTAAAGGLAAAAVLAAGGARRLDAAVLAVSGAALWGSRRRLRHLESRFDVDNQHRMNDLRRGAAPQTVAGVAITPTQRFYAVDVNVGTPLLDADSWRLELFGDVERPRNWTLEQLAEIGLEEFEAVMVCVHNQLGWTRLGNAQWLGVPLSTLLDRAGVSSDATTLVTRAVDGYTISLPLEVLRRMPGYLVVGMNGTSLPARHGFPARVFVPGLYGQYTGVKWVTQLQVTTGPHADYWAKRGWPRESVLIRPMSRIDSPRDGASVTGSVKVAGVAWAPPLGLARVEIAVDDADWEPADLAPERTPTAWRQWTYTIDLPAGEHQVRTRAVSADGTVQDATPRPPFPSGVSGHHTITVTVP